MLPLRNERETLLKVKDAIRAESQRFDMTVTCNEQSCKTIMCIGGWAYHIENPDATPAQIAVAVNAVQPSNRYYRLFYPQSAYWIVGENSVYEACAAIENFLNDPEADPWVFADA